MEKKEKKEKKTCFSLSEESLAVVKKVNKLIKDTCDKLIQDGIQPKDNPNFESILCHSRFLHEFEFELAKYYDIDTTKTNINYGEAFITLTPKNPEIK